MSLSPSSQSLQIPLIHTDQELGAILHSIDSSSAPGADG
jgi:hypothetical protein